MENSALEEALLPSQGYSKNFETKMDDNEGVGSFLKTLEESIQAEFSPRLTKLPFSAKLVVPLGNSSFFLMASSGKACYFSDMTSPVIDISHITKQEIWTAAMISEYDVLFLTFNGVLIRIDMRSVTETFRIQVQGPKNLAVQGSSYYLLTSGNLYIFSIVDNKHKCVKFWDDLEPTEVAIKNEYAIVSMTSPNIKVLNMNETKIAVAFNTVFKPLHMEVSENLLVVTFEEKIEVFKLGSWDLIRTIHTKIDKFVAADLSPGEQFVAACTKKGYVCIWYLNKNTLDPQVFLPAVEDPKRVKFIDESTVFVHNFNEDKLGIAKMHSFRNTFTVKSEENPVNDIVYLEHNDTLFFTIRDKGIVTYKAEDLTRLKAFISNKDIRCTINQSKSMIFATINNHETKDITIEVLNSESLASKNSLKMAINTENWWMSAFAARNKVDQFVCLYASGLTHILDDNIAIKKSITIHKIQPTAIACLNSGAACISGDSGGNVIHFNLETVTRTGNYKQHLAPISAIEISRDDSLVICASSDGVIRISKVESRSCIYSMKDIKYNFTKLYLTLDMQYLMGTSEEKVFCIWDLSKRTLIAKKEGVYNFLFFKDDTKLLMCLEDEYKLIEQPLSPENIAAIGSSTNYLDFFAYIVDILDREKHPEYRPEFSNHLILPHRINAVHLYAYFNSAKMLRQALASNCLMVESAEGKTPLSICLSNQSSLMNEVVDYLINQTAANPGYAYFFKGLLSEINRQGSVHLERLYDTLFKDTYLKQLPEFCSKEVPLPVVIETKNTYNLNSDEFFDREKIKYDIPVVFKQFMVEMNFFQGSETSIDFIESIMDCPNEEIFRSTFISMLLNYKWKQNRWIMFMQGVVYLFYLVLLIIYVSYANSTGILIALLFTSVLLTFYEILQMVTIGLDYFKSFLNIADILRGLMFLIYAVVVFLGIEGEFKIGLMSIIVLISFIRGISFFNLFDPTRYMATLVFEVFKDLVAFGIILTYSIIAIATLNISLINENYDQDFFSLLMESFTLSLGDFDLSEFSVYQKFMFLAAIIINMIVMLNLLISILGDTFDRVQQGQVEANRRAIAEMIVEVEKQLFWKRKKGDELFFTMCAQEGLTDIEGDAWEGKIRSVLNSITDTKQALISDNADIKKSTHNELDQLKMMVKSLNESVAQIKLSLRDNSPNN